VDSALCISVLAHMLLLCHYILIVLRRCVQHISLGCAPKEFYFLKVNIYRIISHKEHYLYWTNKQQLFFFFPPRDSFRCVFWTSSLYLVHQLRNYKLEQSKATGFGLFVPRPSSGSLPGLREGQDLELFSSSSSPPPPPECVNVEMLLYCVT
jgi:hypothetical protein